MAHYFTNDKLESNMKLIDVFVLGRKYSFYTDNGVFSKDGLDFGSRLLLESIPLGEVGGKILDMGCGFGVIGLTVANNTSGIIDMVDVNLRAIHLAKMNAKKNNINNVNVFESSCYTNVVDKYSTIITNPPIRAGKKIVYEIVMGAKDYLLDDGKLFIVIRKEQGAKSLILDLEKLYYVNIINKKKGFFILECMKK